MTTSVVEAAPHGLIRSTFRAMASDVSITTHATADHDGAVATIADVFENVESQCTRFDPLSDLMRANSADGWTRVGPYCYRALREAHRAYRVTGGRFDPRVLRTLEQLGYVASLPFAAGGVTTAAAGRPAAPADRPWEPGFDDGEQSVLLGPDPVDLGGIGKGLAVRWASRRAAAHSLAFVLDAGGDCYLHGMAPDGQPWRVGIEDPAGDPTPIGVLALSDVACATSSIRLRRWSAGGRPVHHLIDPHTGQPGGEGLLAVTVVDPDPARAEIWSKVLFLHGAERIAAAAEHAAAAWVDVEGELHLSDRMRTYIVWQAA